MSVPTDRDRAKADAIVSRMTYKGEAFSNRAIMLIAQALADERAECESAFRPCNDWCQA